MTTQLGFQAQLDLPYDDAVQRVTEALKSEGFGVLTEINVQATLKEKLDADFRQYVILGACNPPLAHRALSANLDVGLLMPCNVIVYEAEEGGSVVNIVDPNVMLAALADDQVVCDVAAEARVKLENAFQSLQA
jgi:uncharacterized protein (DUF302 family)